MQNLLQLLVMAAAAAAAAAAPCATDAGCGGAEWRCCGATERAENSHSRSKYWSGVIFYEI
jgi:hypothetical protein